MRKPISVLGSQVPVRSLWAVLCWSVALLWAVPAQADTPRTSAAQPAWLERPLLARLSKPAELHTRFQHAWFSNPSSSNAAKIHEALDTKLQFSIIGDFGFFVSVLTSLPVFLGVAISQLVVALGKNLNHKRVWGIVGIIVSALTLAWASWWLYVDASSGMTVGAVGHPIILAVGLGVLAWSIVNLVAGLKQPAGLAEAMPFTIIPTLSASATEGTSLGFACVGHF